ncbi:hypothetical protein ES705_41130 [subsurface metagenome]
MNQLVIPQEQVQPIVTPTLLQVQSFTATMSVIMAVWVGTFVLSQVIKVVKGEEIEKPPIIG